METWTIIGAIATVLASIATAAAVFLMACELREMRYANYAQTFIFTVQWLQDEKTRQARQTTFQLRGKPLESWSEEETVAAETVCHTYDAIGTVTSSRLVPKKMVIDNWGASIGDSWDILSPLVEKYRQERNAPETWDGFEWLASESKKRLRRSRPKAGG
jgi:hypothetical protein